MPADRRRSVPNRQAPEEFLFCLALARRPNRDFLLGRTAQKALHDCLAGRTGFEADFDQTRLGGGQVGKPACQRAGLGAISRHYRLRWILLDATATCNSPVGRVAGVGNVPRYVRADLRSCPLLDAGSAEAKYRAPLPVCWPDSIWLAGGMGEFQPVLLDRHSMREQKGRASLRLSPEEAVMAAGRRVETSASGSLSERASIRNTDAHSGLLLAL